MIDMLAISLAGVVIYVVCLAYERWDERRSARAELDRLAAQHETGATAGDESP